MISMTFNDHNLDGQPGQLATGKLQCGSKQRSTYANKRIGASALTFVCHLQLHFITVSCCKGTVYTATIGLQAVSMVAVYTVLKNNASFL